MQPSRLKMRRQRARWPDELHHSRARALCEFASLKRCAASRNEHERHRPRLVCDRMRIRNEPARATQAPRTATLGTNLNTTFSSISSQLK